MTFALSLPPSCRQSVAHALLTCGGGAPAYFTPGFPPPQLGLGLAAVRSGVGGLDRQGNRAGRHARVADTCDPCSDDVCSGRRAARSRGGRRGAVALRSDGRRQRAGRSSGGSRAAADRVAGYAVGRPPAGGAQRHGAIPCARDCASHGPPAPAPLARQQHRPPVTCFLIRCCFEFCTACCSTLAPQPLIACTAYAPDLRPVPDSSSRGHVRRLRRCERAAAARLCAWRTPGSSTGLGLQLLGGPAARHCKQRCAC